MPVIKPFKGVRYNKDVVGNLSGVIAPPYDVISDHLQKELYRSHTYNIVRLILGKISKTDSDNDNRYTRASKFFESWLKRDVMVQDAKPALYIYSQSYKEGSRYIDRVGFIGLIGLDDASNDKVLPHENTLLAPKMDRLHLIRSVRANLSPIFVLYDDKGHKISATLKKFSSKEKALIDIKFDNVRHRVWALTDEHLIGKIEKAMRDLDIFIADGHHRYEITRAYSREIQNKDVPERLKRNSKFMMVYFVATDERILTILPAHRLIKDIGRLTRDDIRNRLEKFFYINKENGFNALLTKMAKSRKTNTFGVYLGKGVFYLLKLKDPKVSDKVIDDKSKVWKRLDVAILHSFILKHVLGIRDDDDNVIYVKEPKEAVGLVDTNKYKVAFFLNPTKVSQVKRIASLGEKMPKKATYFYPKPLSGLVINKLY